MVLKSRIDDGDVMVALCDASQIREGPRATGAAEPTFRGRMFPSQNPFYFRHVLEVYSVWGQSMCLL